MRRARGAPASAIYDYGLGVGTAVHLPARSRRCVIVISASRRDYGGPHLHALGDHVEALGDGVRERVRERVRAVALRTQREQPRQPT